MSRLMKLPLIALGLLLALSVGASAKNTIVIQTWGGPFVDALNGVKADIEKSTGTRIEFVTQATSVAGLQRLEAQKHDPQVDLWMTANETAARALAEGIITPVPGPFAKLIPNLRDIPKELVFPTGPTLWSSPRGIFYNVDKTPFTIKTWQDLWDPRLKGMVTTSITEDKGMFLIIAARLAGGSAEDIGPGFKKLKALKPNIGAVYTSDAEPLRLVEDGEVNVIGYAVFGVVYKLLGPGSKYRFVMPTKPQFMSLNLVTMVKGRPHQADAARVLNALLDPRIQERIVGEIGSVPSNKHAEAPPRLRHLLPPLGHLITPNWNYVNAHYGEWVNWWNREILSR